jgi:uncharacterized membrane protein YjgN (DUF898 family)
MKTPQPGSAKHTFSDRPTRLQFQGSGSALFWILFKGVVISAATFGIYWFWSLVEMRKYFWGKTTVGDDQFSYHGTGRELFVGAFKLSLLAGVLSVALSALAFVAQIPPALASLFFYAGVAFLLPYVSYLSRCFLLSRTEFRGVRFAMANEASKYASLYFKHLFLTFLTLGFHYPEFRNQIYSFKINRMFYGDVRFSYTADHKPLQSLYFKCWLLALPTLGLSIFWFKACETTYQTNNTKLGPLQIVRNYRPVDVFRHEAIFYLGSLATLGLAAPWLFAWKLKYYIEHNAVVGKIPNADNAVLENQPTGVIEAMANAVGAA